MRQRLLHLVLSVAAASLLMVFPAFAEEAVETSDEGPFSLNVIGDFVSDYIYRGVNYYDGISIQPSVNATYSLSEDDILGASIWMHLPGEGGNGPGGEDKFTEADFTLNYEHNFGPVALGVGHVWYTYPDEDDDIADTAEVFGSIAFDTVLSPRLTVYHDYRDIDAQYYELSFSQEIEDESLGDNFNVTPYVNLGFATEAEKVYDKEEGLVQITTGLATDLKLGNIFVITPSLNYTFGIDDATDSEFWMKLAISYDI